MPDCCALWGGSDGEQAKLFESKRVKARKVYQCDECCGEIKVGVVHEYAKGLWGDHFSTFRTCVLCVEIRNHFSCTDGWLYGHVWEQLADSLFRDMVAGGPCLEGLSPEAKGFLFERRLAWLGM